MKAIIEKIKNLRNNGAGPCNGSIEFLESCKTPQEALKKATWSYLEWLLDALKVDFKKEWGDYRPKVGIIDAEFQSKYDAIYVYADFNSNVDALWADYKSKRHDLDDDYANSLRKLVPMNFCENK